MTEIGIGNDRVVEQHHQRQEGAGAIEREIACFAPSAPLELRGRR